MAKKIGRPTVMTEEVKNEILSRLIEGESLRSITRDEDMPTIRTVMYHLRKDEAFFQQYALAREEQADTYADEIVDIADKTDDPAKARLQIDARKWVASKLKSKSYGDKVDVTSGGDKLDAFTALAAAVAAQSTEDSEE